jgi:outer membrane protein TolC
MVALYNSFLNPFVVLFSIPVALTGALIALAVTMKSLNVFSIFGAIMMLGLVAKNAILLVDKTNELKKYNYSTLYAILNSGKTRLRPILMTTLAMVIGMLPMAFQQGASAEYISAMAWVLVGGLTSSMIFTLFVVPAIYIDLERLKVKINRSFSISFKLNSESMVRSTQSPNQSAGSNMNKKRDGKNQGGLSIILILILLAQGFSTKTNAQQISLSLRDAESRVMSDNPEINIQKQNISKAKLTIAEARSLYLPTISFSSTFYHHFNAPKFYLPASLLIPEANPDDFMVIDATDKNVYQNDFLLVQPLIQFENGPILANSKLNLENANLQTRITEHQKVADVRKAYYDALWAKEQAGYLNEIIKRQLQLLDETRLRMKQGFLTESDTLMVFVQVENIKPQLVKVSNAYSLAEKQLKLLLNFSGNDTLALTDSLVFKPEIQENTDPRSRPDLQQLNLKVKMHDNQLKLEKAKTLPNLQFFAQYSISTQRKDFNFNDYNWINSNFAMLQLYIPIFTGMRNSSRIQQAKIERRQAEETYQYSIKQADLEIKTCNTTLNELSQQIGLQSMVEKSAQRLYRLVHNRWQQGLAKQGELHDAELALQQATLNKIGLIYQYLMVQSELKRIRGV